MISRHSANPIISPSQMPYPSTLTYNAGVAQYRGQYIMIFRNYDGPAADEATNLTATTLAWATSKDGLVWNIKPDRWIEPEAFKELLAPFCGRLGGEEILRVYDPRLTVVEDELYLCFAADTLYGTRGGVGRIAADLRTLEILSLSAPDNRNFVLFPEKINNRYIRLERPMPVYSPPIKEWGVWLSTSLDCVAWDSPRIVLYPNEVPFANSKLGPAAPPLKTKAGWLTLFHAISVTDQPLKAWDSSPWHKTYLPGVMLLNLVDPSKVIGLSRKPLFTPTEPYELEGFRGSVVFPGALIPDNNGKLLLYYGAADTVEACATVTEEYLLSLCEPL